MNRKAKRRRKRKLKKWFKIFLISILVIVAIILIIMFGFKLKSINVSLDLNQFTESEVKQYLDAKGIDNTLEFWLKSKIGAAEKIDLFEEYYVSLDSPFKVTITAKEKILKGFVKEDNLFYYIDSEGKILKVSSEEIKGIPKITGLEYNTLELYNKVPVKNKKQLDTLINTMDLAEEYNFEIKKINVSSTLDISLFIKKVQVDLGKEKDLNKKLETLNNIYYNSSGGKDVFEDKCVLNMKTYPEDGVYIVEYPEKDKNNSSKDKKE